MASYKCPFCHNTFVLTSSTARTESVYFEEAYSFGKKVTSKDEITVYHYKCPECNEISIFAIGNGEYFKGKVFHIRPRSNANVLPEYVPEHIRQDYEEAYLIADLSPKASATLSRRCLQSMIRDFFKVKHGNLHNEIEQIKDKIEIDSYEALMAVKSIGNVGAHPTLDPELDIIIGIEPGEAKQLLELVEMFIDEWYVARHNREQRIKKVKELSVEKGA